MTHHFRHNEFRVLLYKHTNIYSNTYAFCKSCSQNLKLNKRKKNFVTNGIIRRHLGIMNVGKIERFYNLNSICIAYRYTIFMHFSLPFPKTMCKCTFPQFNNVCIKQALTLTSFFTQKFEFQ